MIETLLATIREALRVPQDAGQERAAWVEQRSRNLAQSLIGLFHVQCPACLTHMHLVEVGATPTVEISKDETTRPMQVAQRKDRT